MDSDGAHVFDVHFAIGRSFPHGLARNTVLKRHHLVRHYGKEKRTAYTELGNMSNSVPFKRYLASMCRQPGSGGVPSGVDVVCFPIENVVPNSREFGGDFCWDDACFAFSIRGWEDLQRVSGSSIAQTSAAYTYTLLLVHLCSRLVE